MLSITPPGRKKRSINSPEREVPFSRSVFRLSSFAGFSAGIVVSNVSAAANQATFSVRWTGWFVPQISGDQVFKLRADGGVRLFVNGQKLIDDWDNPPLPPNKSGPTPAFSGKIHLQAGQKYSVEIDYHRVVGFTPISNKAICRAYR
jgi:hypothetical protein